MGESGDKVVRRRELIKVGLKDKNWLYLNSLPRDEGGNWYILAKYRLSSLSLGLNIQFLFLLELTWKWDGILCHFMTKYGLKFIFNVGIETVSFRLF